jgi:hypothetical protein
MVILEEERLALLLALACVTEVGSAEFLGVAQNSEYTPVAVRSG